MKIALLCEFGTINGGEQSLLAALEQLEGTVEPMFLAPSHGRLADRIHERGYTRFPWDVRDHLGRRCDNESIKEDLLKHLARMRPDILHANSLSMGRLSGALADQSNCHRSAHLRDIIRLSTRAVADLNCNHQLIAVSRATQDYHVAQGLDAHRISVVYNGVDPEIFRPAASPTERAALRAQLGFPVDARIAVTIGQIGLRKGLDVLANAAPELAGAIPNLYFVIVGERYSAKAESRQFEVDLRASFESAGLADRVHWLGYRDDVPSILRAVDLLIHPARQEPFGRVLLEAASTGLSIVSADVGGTPEMLVDGESARLIPPDNADALTSVVTDLLTDPAQRQRIGAAARRRVIERFSVQDAAKNLARIWQALLDL